MNHTPTIPPTSGEGFTMKDTIHGGIATSLWVTWLAGLTLNEWAALAGLIFSMMMIFDKLSPVPLNAIVAKVCRFVWARAIVPAFRWVWSRVRRRQS